MVSDLFSLASVAVAQRLLLVLNHVISGEPEALKRLQPHTGRSVSLRVQSGSPLVSRWPPLVMQITPAGLFELREDVAGDVANLSVVLDAADPVAGLMRVLSGQRPRMEIAGEAALAADVNWLFENLRWDAHDDLARWLGDAPAHELGRVARSASAALERVAGWAARVLSNASSSRP